MGTVLLGDTEGTPGTFASKNAQWNLRMRSKVRDVQVKIETFNLENSYRLYSYRIDGSLLAVRDPSDERL